MNNDNNKKKKFPIWAIILIIFVCIGVIGNIIGIDTDSNNNGKDSKEQKKNIDTSATIYDDGNYIFKITGFDEGWSTETIKIKIYLENKTDDSIVFTLENPIVIDGYTVDGGYLYEEISGGTKKNVEVNMYGLTDNNLKSTSVKELTFGLSIYKSKNLMIEKKIIDNKQFKYEFKR